MATGRLNINSRFWIERRGNDVITNLMHEDKEETFTVKNSEFNLLDYIYNIMNKTNVSPIQKDKAIMNRLKMLKFEGQELEDRLINADIMKDAEEANAMANFETGLQLLINFFSEFNVDPSPRFVDTLLRQKNKKQYVVNYFKLSDHPAAREIAQKVNNTDREFDNIIKMLNYTPTKTINKHLAIYFGPAGTGKTTKACSQADFCIVCASDMTCRDLLQNFDFDAGKASFEKSDLWLAIEQGKTVCLDEINLLNRDALQFLQGLTDGKETIDYLGTKIKIHPDFKIIGTMNLVVNGMTFPLAEPLVDRCYEIEEYKLGAKDLYKILVT